jgi:hypothetical protein
LTNKINTVCWRKDKFTKLFLERGINHEKDLLPSNSDEKLTFYYITPNPNQIYHFYRLKENIFYNYISMQINKFNSYTSLKSETD